MAQRLATLVAAVSLTAGGGCGGKDDRERPAAETAAPVERPARTGPVGPPPPPGDARVSALKRCWGEGQPSCRWDPGAAAALVDLRHELGLILVAGDDAVVTFAVHGREREGRPGSTTGRIIGLLGAQRVRVAGGTVSAPQYYVDGHSLVGQLGRLPPDASYRAAAQPGGLGQTRIAVAGGDDAEAANLAAAGKVEAALARGAIDQALAGFAERARFIYVPGPSDAAGTARVGKELGAWRKRAGARPPAVTWTLAAGEHVALGVDTAAGRELHLLRFAGGVVAELWIYADRPASPRRPAKRGAKG